MSPAFDERTRQVIIEVAKEIGVHVHPKGSFAKYIDCFLKTFLNFLKFQAQQFQLRDLVSAQKLSHICSVRGIVILLT